MYTYLFGSQIYNIHTNRHVFITVQTYIRVITKLPNSEQSHKGKVKTHHYIDRQNQSTTGKHVAFLSADYRECNQVAIGLWLTWCELVNVAIHTCEHFMIKFLLNK